MDKVTPSKAESERTRLLRDKSGATAIEYGLIAAAVGLTLVAVMPAFNQATNDTYTRILNYFYQI